MMVRLIRVNLGNKVVRLIIETNTLHIVLSHHVNPDLHAGLIV